MNKNKLSVLCAIACFAMLFLSCPAPNTPDNPNGNGETPTPPEPTITSSIVDLYFEGGKITNTKITNNLSDNTQSLPSYSSNLNDTDIKILTPNIITSLTPYIVSLVRLMITIQIQMKIYLL